MSSSSPRKFFLLKNLILCRFYILYHASVIFLKEKIESKVFKRNFLVCPMNDPYSSVLAIILLFLLGYSLKKLNFFTKEHADLFLKMVFYLTLPSIILLTIPTIPLDVKFIYLPISAVIIYFLTFSIAYIVGRLYQLEEKVFGVFLIASMIMNLGFNLPFVLAFYGQEGVVLATLFDLGNGFLTLTFAYYWATRMGSAHNNNTAQINMKVLKKFLYSPPLWALGIGFILNLADFSVPTILTDFINHLTVMTTPLIMLSLGIYFSPNIKRPKLLVSVLMIRMVGGFIFGVLLVLIFSVKGSIMAIIIISAAAPVGFNTLTFTALEELDKDFAASVVSTAIALGLFYVPLLTFLLQMHL